MPSPFQIGTILASANSRATIHLLPLFKSIPCPTRQEGTITSLRHSKSISIEFKSTPNLHAVASARSLITVSITFDSVRNQNQGSREGFIHGWGIDGHYIVCKIAQDRLSKSANSAVNDLLPSYAQKDLSSLCSRADRVKFIYHWSSPLHFINTPEVCNYNHQRDCKNEICVAGAISNYTNQLTTTTSARKSGYNKTEALLFHSHFMGDIHQPLHCGFAKDKGGNKIDVRWYRRKAVLHHVWDNSIIETALKDYYDSDINQFVDALKKNITKGDWSDQVRKWETCDKNSVTCPDVYASESITAACEWAYKDATEGTTLGDEYFNSRLPVVSLRLAEAGVRLAATLNRIFG